MRTISLFLICGMMLSLTAYAADAQAKKKGDSSAAEPAPEVLKQIEARTAQLAAKIAELRKGSDPGLLPDVEIYLRAAQNIVRFKEFSDKNSGKSTLDVLDRGLQRAEELAQGKPSWIKLKNVARGYRSSVDDTAQPYGVTYPLDYGKDPTRKWRVDVVLHGRGNVSEVAFLQSHNGSRKASAAQDWVQIDIFGRGNNAYRWAGETDVLEATKHFQLGEGLDAGRKLIQRQPVLRGFSMGGAGTWHLGLHHPDLWCVMGPGAGFTTTHGYAGGLPKPLPPYQEPCLHIYDAVDYAENAVNIPIVAYSGGADAQKAAADNVEKRLKELHLGNMTHLVAPGLGHSFPQEWFKKANALWSQHAAASGQISKKQISFVTYTLKYPGCYWVTLTGLEKHYEKASVKADATDAGFRITTRNVNGLHIQAHFKADKYAVTIDGQDLAAEPENRDVPVLHLMKQGTRWQAGKIPDTALRKRSGLQGPIDDAFASGFVCVTGNGSCWHDSTAKHVDARLDAFGKDWAKHWRGELPIVAADKLTKHHIANKHLILFGDPSSNRTLAEILPKLPLRWTRDEIEFNGKKYKAAEHVPVMIFPNPLNPRRYVVLNTGHTFPSGDYAKTNAMLFPRLGDYALLRLTPTARDAAAYEVADAGLFNEQWELPQAPR